MIGQLFKSNKTPKAQSPLAFVKPCAHLLAQSTCFLTRSYINDIPSMSLFRVIMMVDASFYSLLKTINVFLVDTYLNRPLIFSL